MNADANERRAKKNAAQQNIPFLSRLNKHNCNSFFLDPFGVNKFRNQHNSTDSQCTCISSLK